MDVQALDAFCESFHCFKVFLQCKYGGGGGGVWEVVKSVRHREKFVGRADNTAKHPRRSSE